MREFFASNMIFVYLVYGFAFVSMGLALSVLVRTPLLLPSVRMLWLLAGFGLLHGLGEWADMAVLIKQQAGDPDAALILEAIGLGLFVASFVVLLQFGVSLLAGLVPRLRWLHVLPLLLLLLWGVLVLALSSSGMAFGSAIWLESAEALCRYVLGLPGGLVAAGSLALLGLWWSGPRSQRITRTLLGSAILLALYALFSGLVPPQAPIFLASVLNSDSFLRTVGIPVQVFRGVVALAVGALVAETFIVESSRVLESTGRALAMLNESLRDIVSEPDLEGTLLTVVQRARQLLGTDVSFLSLVSADDRKLVMAASTGVQTKALRHLQLDVQHGLAGEALRTGRPVVVENYAQSTGLVHPPVEVMRNEGLVSGIAAPLVKETKLLGVLYVFNRRWTRFGPFDVDLMAAFAGEAAIAIDRSQLVADLNRERERLTLALEQLAQVEKEREEFVSIVAHDLRGPIQVIGGFAELLQRMPVEKHGDEKEKRALANIVSSADRLQRMVSDLLDASRLEAHRLQLRLEPVDLRELVGDVVQRQAQLVSGHDIRFHMDETVRVVRADPTRVEQILSNLLSNAAKYSDPETPILVSVEAPPPEAPVEAVISVTNEGDEIPPDEIPKLFSRFHRAQAAQAVGKPGLGLGLYIAKGLVQSHGGRIWVTSGAHRTTFTFTLPLESGAESRR